LRIYLILFIKLYRCFKHDPPLLLLADELPTCASGDAGRQSLAAFTTALKGCQNKVKLVGLDLEAAQEARKKELPLAHEDRSEPIRTDANQ